MSLSNRCWSQKNGEESKSPLQQEEEEDARKHSVIDGIVAASTAYPINSRAASVPDDLSLRTEDACCLGGYEASVSGLSSTDSRNLDEQLVLSPSPCSDLDSFTSESEQSAVDRKKNFKIRWDGVTTSAGSGSTTLSDRYSNKDDNNKPSSVSVPRNITAFNNKTKFSSKENDYTSLERGFDTNKKMQAHSNDSGNAKPAINRVVETMSNRTSLPKKSVLLQSGESHPAFASRADAATYLQQQQPKHSSLGGRCFKKRMLAHQQDLSKPVIAEEKVTQRNSCKLINAASTVKIQQPFHPSSRVVARLHAPQLQKQLGLGYDEDPKVPATDAELIITDDAFPTTKQEENPIYSIGVDSLAHCLSYLDPSEVLSFVTSPLSKTWKEVYCDQGYLWKVLCISEPFYAKENIIEEDEEYDYQFRLLYTRFVRCITYLKRIRTSDPVACDSNTNFLSAYHDNNASATSVVAHPLNDQQQLRSSFNATFLNDSSVGLRRAKRSSFPLCNALDGSNASVSKIPKTALPQETEAQPGKTNVTAKVVKKLGNHVDLPWSCAVYAIINWMVAFREVLGIQIACLKALPLLLEDERQRSTAQVSRLSGIVIQSMVEFKDSIQLHTAAFHTLVLLARPIGGKEGMLFQRAMVGSPATFMSGDRIDSIHEEPGSNHVASINNGTCVILDSMRRFDHNEELQAMGCWSMVNIALVASQKTTLVRLGGISVLLHAMKMHPNCADVQFRALFALINLVVPCEHQQQQGPSMPNLGSSKISLERQILDDAVSEVASLVVSAMEKFCVVKDVLNRACLVLHNLSLISEYHSALLWTPHCYQMLLWASNNHQNDKIIMQSASGTLQRLNHTLADDEDLRMRFSNWINKVDN